LQDGWQIEEDVCTGTYGDSTAAASSHPAAWTRHLVSNTTYAVLNVLCTMVACRTSATRLGGFHASRLVVDAASLRIFSACG